MTKKVVCKYQIPIEDYHSIEMPFGAEILHFAKQYGVPTLWALVEPSRELIKRRFRLAETGYDIVEDGLKYIGTIKMLGDKFIYHLFEY